ncbi:hypothetical protein ABZ860_40205 [Microbispora sp. NPDC046973]|uniref:hypothetical protein n=1 Tax=Microbispora sp. NPDC046973 TaxID=3155022 RepID=UPI003404F381
MEGRERDATGHPVLAAQVRNTGGRALDLSGSLSLSEGPGGLRAGPYPAVLGVTLRPGETGRPTAASRVTLAVPRTAFSHTAVAGVTTRAGIRPSSCRSPSPE